MVQTHKDTGAPVPSPRATPPATFSDFYRAGYRRLVKSAMAIGASLEEAEDVVHDVMIDVHQRWDTITYPLPYAAQAVRHAVIKARERDRRLARALQGGPPEPAAHEDDGLAACDRGQWVAQLLAALTPGQRQVLDLQIEGLSYAEIAELIGKSPDTVRKQAQLGRERLSPLLEDNRQIGQGASVPATAPTRREDSR